MRPSGQLVVLYATVGDEGLARAEEARGARERDHGERDDEVLLVGDVVPRRLERVGASNLGRTWFVGAPPDQP